MVNLSLDMDWTTYFPNWLDTSWWATLGNLFMADCKLGGGAHHAFLEHYKQLKIGSLPCCSCFGGVCLQSLLWLFFYGQGDVNNEVCGMSIILWNRVMTMYQPQRSNGQFIFGYGLDHLLSKLTWHILVGHSWQLVHGRLQAGCGGTPCFF